jgi:hypothetical protein
MSQPKPAVKKIPWFVQFDGSDFGPFSVTELETLLQSGKLKGRIHVWNRELDSWKPVESIAALKDLIKGLEIGPSTRSEDRILKKTPEPRRTREERQASRVPLLATVGLEVPHNQNPIPIGLCSDLSRTGMQVLLDTGDKIKDDSFEKGKILHLQIWPDPSTQMDPVLVRCCVAWFNAQERRLGVEFVNLDDDIRIEITKYIRAVQERNET